MHTLDNYSRPDIPALAQGRWTAILTDLGVDPAFLTGKHGPCPGCGGTDRHRFDNQEGRGTFYCSGGGNPTAGDGFDLLCHVFGWSKAEAFKAVRRWLGLDPTADAPKPRQRPIPAPVAAPPKRDLGPYARALWARANREDSAVAGHPYAVAKRVDWACGAGRAFASGRKIGKEADCIIVPVRTPAGEVCAVECLADHRDAHGKFVRQAFGDKSRGWLTIGNDLDPKIPRYVVEGWATGARLAKTKRNCCIFVAFGSGRLLEVAEQIERRASGSTVLICAEAAHA
jgi:putative DNA primase/helicase